MASTKSTTDPTPPHSQIECRSRRLGALTKLRVFDVVLAEPKVLVMRCTWFPYNAKIYFSISNLCFGVKVLKNDDTSKGAMHNHLRQTVEICNGLTILT